MIRLAASFAVSDVLHATLALATSLIVARGLGVEAFGRWMLCLAWSSTLMFALDLGFGLLLGREAARDRHDLGRTLSQALLIRVLLFVPAAALLAAVMPVVVDDAAVRSGLRFAIVIAAGGVLCGCFAAVFRGRPEWLVPWLVVDAAGALMQCALSWWIVARGEGFVELLRMSAVVQATQLAAAAAMWRRVRPPARGLTWPPLSSLVPVARTALPFALSGLVANAQMRMAPLALGAFSTPASVASFGVAWRIASTAKLLPHAAFAGALPAFIREKRDPAVRRLRLAGGGGPRPLRVRLDRAIIVFGGTAALAVGLLAAPLVRVIYGSEFAAATVPLMWVGAWILPSLVNSGRRVYLIAHDHERVALRWSTTAFAVQAAGCLALIPAFGASGAAAAMTIGELATWWPLSRAAAAIGAPGDSSRRVARAEASRSGAADAGPHVRVT